MFRELLYRAMYTKRGDFFLPFRLQKKVWRTVHELLGSPLKPPEAPKEEAAAAKPEPAPVMVYYEKDRNVRELVKIEETLRARSIVYKLLDVSGDAATISFVTREAGVEGDDLPVVFVAGAPVGCYNELVQWDVSGRLASAVFG